MKNGDVLPQHVCADAKADETDKTNHSHECVVSYNTGRLSGLHEIF